MSNQTIKKNGTIKWQSPSNLAIIKYWGKFGSQFPRNTSISFTLDKAHTITQLKYNVKDVKDEQISLSFTFEGKQNEAFEHKVKAFLNKINNDYFPFLKSYHLHFDSFNSFPHSSGIASSASGMSALALCLCTMENELYGTLADTGLFYRKASYIARLGSGSACRSIFPYMALWGSHADIEASSNEIAIPYEDKIHPVFKNYHDDILILSNKEKSVSSTAGHGLMENNPFADSRYKQANERMLTLLKALEDGNTQLFGEIAEAEALTLHALMMCSEPSYMLIDPKSVEVINLVRQYRLDTKIPVYFSLDAGPNIHLLYPNEYQSQVSSFVEDQLKPLCYEQRIIYDQVGLGPKKLEN